TNGSFTIRAGTKDSVPSEITATQPVRIWGLLPHTHLRGTRWHYELIQPDSSRQVILDVPHYDFNWQTYYLFAKPLDIPAGARIKSMAWYDNSASNKSNPDPTKEVKWGDQTWEEMQYTGFLYSVQSRRPDSADFQNDRTGRRSRRSVCRNGHGKMTTRREFLERGAAATLGLSLP